VNGKSTGVLSAPLALQTVDLMGFHNPKRQ